MRGYSSSININEAYKAYLAEAERLPHEMRKRGITAVPARFIEADFAVYADGTAKMSSRNQPLLSRLGIRPKVTVRTGLENLGELIYHLSSKKDGVQDMPRHLDQLAPDHVVGLTSALRLSCADYVERTNSIEGL